MTISVAMCTYNGAKYIQEQLDSILHQTKSVDEIVICDDGSTDGTIEIIENISAHAPTNIHVYINETNMGVQRNFEKAIALCHGDLVFLSDQDDVWQIDKVEKILVWFQNNPTKDVVFSDAYIIDEKGMLIPKDRLWRHVEFSNRERFWFDFGLGLEVFLHGQIATGATMALRNPHKKLILALPDKSIYQDEVIAGTALAKNSMGYISEPLMSYRLHDSQSCGLKSYGHRVSALKPFWFGERLEGMPDYTMLQPHIQWGKERLKSKHCMFGWFVVKYFKTYINIYGLKCGVVIMASDIIDSWHHSFYRIWNKIIRTIKTE